MPKIWVITNQKGGVGKTTTVISVAYELAQHNKKVLVIDLDAQGNATSGLGSKMDGERNVLALFTEKADIAGSIQHASFPNIDIISAHPDLIGLQAQLGTHKDRDQILRKVLRKAPFDQYDYIFIDTPPSLGLLTVNALVAAHYLIVPIQAEYFALEGLSQLLKNVALIKQINPDLKIAGLLITMYSPRTNLAKMVEEDVREHFGDKVFKAVIPRTVRLAEAPSFGKPIGIYKRSSKGAVAYQELVKEILKLS